MDWRGILNHEMEGTYHATEGLMGLLREEELDWKPASGSNWMAVRQLLRHVTEACGFCCRGFVTGNWGAPEGGGGGEEALPPAEALPGVASLAEAKRLLAEDKALALKMLRESTDEELAGRMCAAPWDPKNPRALGHHFLHMVGHLSQHKAQLFYYLKLMGKPVHTGHLYGM